MFVGYLEEVLIFIKKIVLNTRKIQALLKKK